MGNRREKVPPQYVCMITRIVCVSNVTYFALNYHLILGKTFIVAFFVKLDII